VTLTNTPPGQGADALTLEVLATRLNNGLRLNPCGGSNLRRKRIAW
jgi:hypothetical protein